MQQANLAAGQTRGPKAITRVLDLLALLAGKQDGMSLAELSAAMTVPKSTFIDTLRGLTDMHYLSCQEGRYRLGPSAYHFASRIVRHWSAPEIIRAQVKQLAAETRESVGFAIADWDIGQAIYIEASNSPQPVRYAMQAGLRAPLYASAAGRLLMAYAGPEQVEDYLARAHLRQLTGNTRTDPGAIRAALVEIREQGYCASFGEMLSDTAALAVPVMGPDGDLLGALMLAAPLDRMKQNFERLLNATLDAGRHASAGS
ncbi:MULTISPECIES: IclR family transcriptional regulator [Sphingobium]|uniref:IclR family transcriptional regulator n=1 Tax=Sphingobium chungbukense TaxID=56193 RepID=A0A0M3APV7_9SPHN|nr:MULTISPECIES: IclR family transcriptional regulator [Sphingobium]KKW91865.1 IclR family transcriptional regulator [Sphingobium chungbukense]PJG46051.1 IclR family transcriptional regulator [Sphingobium sp. LB126]